MKIRPSAIAGSWYPGHLGTLTRAIGHYLYKASVEPPPGQVWGVIAPHAGYRYSG